MENGSRKVSPSDAIYVVGIGASAGGLEALERFFDHVPSDTGMAFVVVQHLSPDFKSLMDQLLARHTELAVQVVEDGVAIEPNHVYLIPPKKEMIISGGKLLLSERDAGQERSLPIDVFFRSLAQECQERAIAVVLSGGGSDGSRGIRDVHEAGGLVVVQDAASAQFDGMPKSALDAGVADFVVPPEAMPGVLVDYAQRPHAPKNDSPVPTPQGWSAIYRMLEDEFGIDFTDYKPSTVTRRIERRLQLARAGDIDEYVERLRSDREELDTLYRDLLIGVTRFFRDEDAYGVLEHGVLPDLLRRGPKDAPLRVWVAGCATGEEAYSLAILLHELTQRVRERPIKIFASDVHRGSLEFAARAVYDAEAVAGVSRERLERYFIARGREYQIVPEIRQMIVFAPHNVVKDAPFTRVDMVSCRNLLIYLQPAAQEKVLSLFHFALNRGGIAFLGPSENPGVLGHDFETLDRHWRIYRKYSDVRMPVDPRLQPLRYVDTRLTAMQPAFGRPPISQLLGTYDALLDDYMPPSLLIGANGELVHAFGGASQFLHIKDGRPGLDIIDIVSPELRMVLTGALRRALKEPEAIVFKGVRASSADESLYRVTLRRVRKGEAKLPHVLVTFEPAEGAASIRPPQRETEMNLNDVSREHVGALEAELTHTKENLQAAIEELETSNEELQAANEELLASNEELQSTNEELQSVNEELYTVNAEYQRKISELTELTNDMDNLLSSTDVGTIFLDSELRVRKFTAQMAEIFNLLPQDVGRSIVTFTHDIDAPNLAEDLQRVRDQGKPVERECSDRKGRAFFLRILPYRAKGAVQGVVLTLIDVSGLKAAEDALFRERYLLESLLSSVPDAIYFRDARGRFIRTNHAMAARLGITSANDAVGRTPFELLGHADALALHEHDEKILETGAAEHYVLEQRGSGWDLATRLPLRDRSGGIVGVIGILRDITDQKRAQDEIQEAVRRRDEFLAMLSHELRNPLGAMVTTAALMKNPKVPDERKKRLVDIVERQSLHMSRLLDDLLEASRVTHDKIQLQRRVVDLRPIVRDAADVMRSVMDERGLSFSVDFGETPLWVDGDAARLQQIQVNLLSNAAKYTPRGGTVTLRAWRDDGSVVVSVRDDGAGIPSGMQESIFDLFVQAGRTLDRAEGGLGVGLTLVRSLVGGHGGTVSARSDGEGKGSEFVVRLPAAVPLATDDEPPRSSARVRRGARIVVIEDNADAREMLCELLSLHGFEAHAADSGVAGLALMKQKRPDAAIVDLGLPGLDGFGVARRVRDDADLRGTLLVALTGYGQPRDRARARDAGFDAHLVKPVETASLLTLLVGNDGATAPAMALDGKPG